MLIEITFRKFVMQWGPLPRCVLLFYVRIAGLTSIFPTFSTLFLRRAAHLLAIIHPH